MDKQTHKQIVYHNLVIWAPIPKLSFFESSYFHFLNYIYFCCCLVTKLCPTLCDPMNYSTPGFLSFTISQSLLKFMSIESVMPSNHLVLCHPHLLLPSVFLSIRVFSNESALHIMWAKYRCFSFSDNPSSE